MGTIRRIPAELAPVAAAIALLAGCALRSDSGAPARGPGARAAIQSRYDAIGEAVRTGDAAVVHERYPADPGGAGSPLAALARATARGRRLVSWTATIHRFRVVGDTAVVDAGTREIARDLDGPGADTTTLVVRGFWVRDHGAWRLVRTEPLGPERTTR